MPYTTLPTRTCLNSAYPESSNSLTVFSLNGNYYVARSMGFDQDIVAVSASCISTVPSPDFTVAGGSSTASCKLATGGTPTETGFPGDTFTITDASAGVWTTATLDVTAGSASGQAVSGFPVTITPGQSVQWPSPATIAPGDYYVTLTIDGGTPPYTVKTISLCANPKAVLTVGINGVSCPSPTAGCAALVNDAVTLGDTGTSGIPNVNPVYLYGPVNTNPSEGNSFNPQANGNYTVGVIVQYPFVAPNDPTCAANAAFFGTVSSGTYNSCAIGTVNVQYGTASFQVEQPSDTAVATATSAGPVNIAQAVTLRYLGRIASGYTPSFQWSIPPAGSLSGMTCTYTGPTVSYTNSTCTIPANTLTAGASAPWNLTVNVCSAGGLGSPPAQCTGTGDPQSQAAAPAVTVTPNQNSFAFSVTPTSVNVGTAITIKLGTVVGTYQNLIFSLGGTSCTGVTQLTYNCVTPFGNQCLTGATLSPTFSYGPTEKGKNDTITATGTLTNSGGTVTSGTSAAVSISSVAATCPCPTVSTSVTGPTSAQVNQQVSFSASASSTGYSITGYSWNYGDRTSDSGSSVSHAYASAGAYTVTVTATSSCGNTGSASTVIEVGGGVSGNLTITPNATNVYTGQTVKFTFSPALTQTGDSITFNFGDGSAAVSQSYNQSLCGGTGCNLVTHSYSAAGSFTVTGSGIAGGANVTGSTSVTVTNNCQLSSAPTAAFTWTPASPRVGQAVQFTDQSTGGPTSWSWTFGDSGSSSSLNAVVAQAASSLAISSSPSNPAVGSRVTFTFSPALTQTGDSLTFNFGDGSAPQLTSYNSSLCGSGGCNSIVYKYTAGGTFNVSASGTAGGALVSGSTSVTVTGSGTGALSIAPSPSSPTAGQVVTFTFSPALIQTGDTLTFIFGDSTGNAVSYNSSLCGASGCSTITHVYTAAGTYSVSASGTAGGSQVVGGTSLTVGSSGGGGGGGSSTLPNPAHTYTAPGTYTVTFVATNCKGQSTLQKQITVLPACAQTAAPTASFTWATGSLATAGFPEQQQPYAGQAVTLTDTSTNAPDAWQWCDFEELGPSCSGTPLTTQNVTVTWISSGQKNVRLSAHNCFTTTNNGWSQQTLEVVTVSADVRHVNAAFTWSPSAISTGTVATFTAASGDSNGDPDTFVWTFDDTIGTVTGSSVPHAFSCAGNHTVTLTSSRADYPQGAVKTSQIVSVTGTPCSPTAVMTVDNAKTTGLNGTTWQTDVTIFNPSTESSAINLQFLPVNANNANPNAFTIGPYTLNPLATQVFTNILSFPELVGANITKAALRVTFQNDQDVAPMVIGRTYTQSPTGGTYGEFAPGIGVVPSTTTSPIWMTGLHNSGLQTGYRTNYSLMNLLGTSPAGNITFTLYDTTGAVRGTATPGLYPYGYLQDSIANLFGQAFATVGTFALRIDVPSGSNVQAYASVVDNQTGAPVLISAEPPPTSPIYLPAVAHTTGKNGTVWRSDLQLTNSDTVPHTWAIAYSPKASDPVNPATVSLAMAPRVSVYEADVLSWVYSNSNPLTASVQTSGVLKITPADGTSVYPVVQARSFNQIATGGTFGQNITPLTASSGISATSLYTHLLLTGMSTTDTGFRTNVGFVNLSETSSVIFSVIFYDSSGNPLNPISGGQPVPYPMSLSVGGWDQDQLENRFKNVFGTTLPANQSGISAVITVTGGGPASVYATVIDNITGDPGVHPRPAGPVACLLFVLGGPPSRRAASSLRSAQGVLASSRGEPRHEPPGAGRPQRRD